MDLNKYYLLIPKLAQEILGKSIPVDWKGIDIMLPFLEKIKKDGGIILIKFDGERTGVNDTGPYTMLISGGSLVNEPIRIDTFVLEHGLAYVIINYAQSCWGAALV